MLPEGMSQTSRTALKRPRGSVPAHHRLSGPECCGSIEVQTKNFFRGTIDCDGWDKLQRTSGWRGCASLGMWLYRGMYSLPSLAQQLEGVISPMCPPLCCRQKYLKPVSLPEVVSLLPNSCLQLRSSHPPGGSASTLLAGPGPKTELPGLSRLTPPWTPVPSWPTPTRQWISTLSQFINQPIDGEWDVDHLQTALFWGEPQFGSQFGHRQPRVWRRVWG